VELMQISGVMMDAAKVIELWNKYGVSEIVRKHSIRVAVIAIFISRKYSEKFNVDMNYSKIIFGSLLHDIGKNSASVQESHAKKGHDILKSEGFYDYANICNEHFTYNFMSDDFSFLESKLVNFSDKFISKEIFFTLNTYFDMLAKYDDIHNKERDYYISFFNSFLTDDDENQIKSILNGIQLSNNWMDEINKLLINIK
jgi:putative nucleotidyltransferase with HDIG domain